MFFHLPQKRRALAAKLLALLTAGTALTWAPAAAQPSDAASLRFVPGEFLVRWQVDAATSASEIALQQFLREVERHAGRRVTLLRRIGPQLMVLQVETADLSRSNVAEFVGHLQSTQEAIAATPQLRRIEPVVHAVLQQSGAAQSLPVPNAQPLAEERGPAEDLRRTLEGVGVDVLWATHAQPQQPITVAVLDSGVLRSHPVFQGLQLVARDARSGTEDVDPEDDRGGLVEHGTGVAGILASTLGAVPWRDGPLPGFRLALIRVARPNAEMQNATTISTADAIAGIDQALAMGARIINVSWCFPGPTSPGNELRDAFQKAERAGALVVAAAGNNGCNSGWGGRNLDSNPNFPATYPFPGIIAVAALDVDRVRAQYSDYGAVTVDVATFGDEVAGAGFTRDASGAAMPRMRRHSGSSFAAPVVSGVAALLLARSPQLTHHELAGQIAALVEPLPPLRSTVATGGALRVPRPSNAGSLSGLATPPSTGQSASTAYRLNRLEALRQTEQATGAPLSATAVAPLDLRSFAREPLLGQQQGRFLIRLDGVTPLPSVLRALPPGVTVGTTPVTPGQPLFPSQTDGSTSLRDVQRRLESIPGVVRVTPDISTALGPPLGRM